MQTINASMFEDKDLLERISTDLPQIQMHATTIQKREQ